MCQLTKTPSSSSGLSAGRTYPLVLIALTTTGIFPANGAIVNFWLSNSMNGPEAPTIEVLANSTTTLDVWTRPAAGLKLLGFSLNLVAQQPGAITFQEVEVHNPPITGSPGTNRHQYLFDSFSDLYDEFNLHDERIDGLLGVSVLDNLPGIPDGGGMGPDCQDSECVDVDGFPAWRIATVTFQAGAAGNSTELYLEISEQGIWHAEEEPTDTSAIFGVGDVEHQWHTPLSPGPDMRDMHFGLPDAVINVVTIISDADFDDDDDVDGVDFLTWQRGFGGGGTHAQGDADGNGAVDGEDLGFWQAQFGTAGSPLVVTVPEPTSLALLTAVLVCGLAGIREHGDIA